MARTPIMLILGLLTLPYSSLTDNPAHAQEPFYKGKTVRIIVGASAGGGYDTYSRTIARHMGKHIPGNPSFAVENMPGAGFLISANHMYNVAKPDGLTIGHFIGGLFLQQLLGKPGVHVYDVNTPERFQQGRLPGATHVTNDTVAERLPEDRNATLIFYCTNPK